jgi:hypothetical protein
MQELFNVWGIFIFSFAGLVIGIVSRRIYDDMQERNKLIAELEELEIKIARNNSELRLKCLIAAFLLFSMKNHINRMEKKNYNESTFKR